MLSIWSKPEFVVEEADVEGGVVDHQLGAANELDEIGDDLGELRLVGKEFVGQAVDLDRSLGHLAVGIDVGMEALSRQLAPAQFDTADFDDAVAGAEIQAGGLGIQDHFSHVPVPCLFDAAPRQLVGALVLGMSGVALDPDPFDRVLRGQAVQFAPQVLVLHRLLARRLPAAPLPAVDPLADALLHVLRIGVHPRRHRALQGAQGLDHGGHFHAVVGSDLLAAEQFPFGIALAQDCAPAAGAGIAAAGAVGKDFYHWSTRCVIDTSALARSLRSCHAGVIRRMPCWRLTACTTYTAPAIGHQRSPAASMNLKRRSHFSCVTAGA
jgi:hypothetical protein